MRSVAVALGLLALTGCAAQPRAARRAAPAVAALAGGSAAAEEAESDPERRLVSLLEKLGRGDKVGGAPRAGARRQEIAPTAFRLDALPTFQLQAAPLPEEWRTNNPAAPAPKLGPVTDALDLTPVDPKATAEEYRHIKITVHEPPIDGRAYAGPGLSTLYFIDPTQSAKSQLAELTTTCGANQRYNPYQPIRWVSLQLVGGARARFVIGDAILDRVTCRAHLVRRTEGTAAALVDPGLLYGARACAATCAERETLMLFHPRSANVAVAGVGGDPRQHVGSFGVTALPIERGGGGSFVANVSGTDMSRWHVALAANQVPPSGRPILFGLEVTQTVRDPLPVAIGYVEDVGDDPARQEMLDKMRMRLGALATPAP